jgi:hypothetical protein
VSDWGGAVLMLQEINDLKAGVEKAKNDVVSQRVWAW